MTAPGSAGILLRIRALCLSQPQDALREAVRLPVAKVARPEEPPEDWHLYASGRLPALSLEVDGIARACAWISPHRARLHVQLLGQQQIGQQGRDNLGRIAQPMAGIADQLQDGRLRRRDIG